MDDEGSDSQLQHYSRKSETASVMAVVPLWVLHNYQMLHHCVNSLYKFFSSSSARLAMNDLPKTLGLMNAKNNNSFFPLFDYNNDHGVQPAGNQGH